ncbi:MAG: biotin--[acetyl-CoA-carboxylase] ligase, partial [Tannerella sp.]|nr:biotin--[acetyl-CoA-carboxylase] ligase [Tannerella sp.]
MKTADFGLPPAIWIDETVSTSTELQQRADAGKLANESALMAGFQTAGRGQVGNFWESAAGENLTCSLLYYPEQLNPDHSFVIAEMAALSVKHLLEEYIEVVSVKWPNDVYWTDRKICGILVENNFSGNNLVRSIIGIGLNLNQVIFHSNAPNP